MRQVSLTYLDYKKTQYLAYWHLTPYLHLTMISLMFLRLWITKRCTLICKILLKLNLILSPYHCLKYASIRVLSEFLFLLKNTGQQKPVFLQILHNVSFNYLCDRNFLFQIGLLMKHVFCLGLSSKKDLNSGGAKNQIWNIILTQLW